MCSAEHIVYASTFLLRLARKLKTTISKAFHDLR